MVSAPSAFHGCCIHSGSYSLYLSRAALLQVCWHCLHNTHQILGKVICLLGIVSNLPGERDSSNYQTLDTHTHTYYFRLGIWLSSRVSAFKLEGSPSPASPKAKQTKLILLLSHQLGGARPWPLFASVSQTEADYNMAWHEIRYGKISQKSYIYLFW